MPDQPQQELSKDAQSSNETAVPPQPSPQSEAAKPLGDSQADAEKAKKRNFIVIGVLLLLAVAGGLFYWHGTYSEDTDDAQVDGNIYQVSSRITGQVTKVYVQDNEAVQAGQVLAEIDPRDYQVALEQAQAQLASAQAEATQANVNIPITSVNVSTLLSNDNAGVTGTQAGVALSESQSQAAAARLEQAQANAVKADADVARYKPLVQRDVISKQQFDAAVAQAAAMRAMVAEAKAQVTAQQQGTQQARQQLAQSRSQASEAARNGPQLIRAERAKASAASANVRLAQARVQQAQLNLSYVKITAPTAGVVNKKNVEVGANLSVGQDLLTIIPLNDLWVTANFKETQLEKMRQGQTVELKVDALGGRKFSGRIAQVGGATGSRLSLFPPENATGNYVKVVQRIPVRINFTNLAQENADYALRPGFSVTPKVAVK